MSKSLDITCHVREDMIFVEVQRNLLELANWQECHVAWGEQAIVDIAPESQRVEQNRKIDQDSEPDERKQVEA